MSEVALQEIYHVEGEIPKRQLPHKINGKWRKATADGHANISQSRPSLIRDAIELQVEMKKQALAENTPVHHKAACARAWTDLCERIRILRGQPMPGVLRPEGSGKSKKRGGKGAEAAGKEAADKPAVQPPAPIVLPPVDPAADVRAKEAVL